MVKRTIGRGALSALMLMFAGVPALADSIITVNGHTYDIADTVTTFNSDSSVLEAQPWYNNLSVANEFATEFGAVNGSNSYDNLNFGDQSSYFAAVFVADGTGGCTTTDGCVNVYYANSNGSTISEVQHPADGSYHFATATLISSAPEPSSIVLALSGLLTAVVVRKRRRD